MRDVTFGITTFNRPTLLVNLVRSIRKRYPTAKIVVANNGRSNPSLPNDVKMVRLPFDCGVSRARNALVDQLDTKYLLILEDDFLFTNETKIEPLVEVLEADPEVGCVGGGLRDIHGRLACYALDIEVFRDRMEVREATHRVKMTPSGLPYRLCDMVWNFCLFRREMLSDHRWIDRLKVGEHCPFFHQVKLGAKWRVATCNQTAIYHVPEPRSKDYLKYRRRAQSLFESYLAEHGIKHYDRIKPFYYEDDPEDRPNIIVLGVGHSGTTVITRMLHQFGWDPADADEPFAESVVVRRLNIGIELHGRLPAAIASQVLKQLPSPWAVKDPRFVRTLHHWLPYFQQMERKPLLLRVSRDRDSMLASYQRRGAPGDMEMTVDYHRDMCQKQYDRWPWERMTIDYDRLGDAVAEFSPTRFAAQQGRLFNRFLQYGSTSQLSPANQTMLRNALKTLVEHARSNPLPRDVRTAIQTLATRPNTAQATRATTLLANFGTVAEGRGHTFPAEVRTALDVFVGMFGEGDAKLPNFLGGMDGDGSGTNFFGGMDGDGSGTNFWGGMDGDGSGTNFWGGMDGDGSGTNFFGGMDGDGSGTNFFGGMDGDGSGTNFFGGLDN